MIHPVAFLHGRPGPHPTHAKYAQAVHADFHFVDFLLRWHDRPAPRLKRYLSWVACAVAFPRRRDYSVFLTEGPHFPPIVMKKLGLLRSDQKTVALMDNETFYFLKEGRYPPATAKGLKLALKQFDALLCIGEMETDLARDVLGPGCPPLYTVFNGIPGERQGVLRELRPRLEGTEIVFIGNGPDGWRVWYKGLDVVLDSLRLSLVSNDRLRLSVIGEWDPRTIQDLLSRAGLAGNPGVRFLGATKNVHEFLKQGSLYLHCGRGDAWAISVMEAMCGGLVPLVSEWTGAKEVVAQVSPELIVPLDPAVIAERILWYFGLGIEERQRLSLRCREVASAYTEERAVRHFVETFDRMLHELTATAPAYQPAQS